MKASFDVITIFPNFFSAYLNEGILKKAIHKGLLDVKIHNLRDYAVDKHKTVDDYPYGGGPGMVFKIEPIYNAVESIKADGVERVTILLSPVGKLYTQETAKNLLMLNKRLLLICGRYEGVDERVRELIVEEEISIGDYVLTGGELPALVIIDSITRLVPGVLGDDMSCLEESFTTGLLEYPHYTRPAEFKGLKVPDVLISGNHQQIKRWRRQEALRRTFIRRSDLIREKELSPEDLEFLRQLKNTDSKV
ncbi:MAG: tRNA (guanosine(37)-N1)-methyltransferase TrmD [Thermodesulfovibrionales bacterium]|nr:tRNA (guanosine(37)-N1)-methyltransferase TrmD [Thermodesulfovibrionales bacterium]